MKDREELIKDIIANFQAMKNKMHAKMGECKEKDNITHSQLFALAIIAKNENIGVKEVAKKLNISASAATQLVDGLVEKEYVTRKTNIKDRRALELEISVKGKKHIARFQKHHFDRIKNLFSDFSEAELRMYNKIQGKILKKINEKK